MRIDKRTKRAQLLGEIVQPKYNTLTSVMVSRQIYNQKWSVQ